MAVAIISPSHIPKNSSQDQSEVAWPVAKEIKQTARILPHRSYPLTLTNLIYINVCLNISPYADCTDPKSPIEGCVPAL